MSIIPMSIKLIVLIVALSTGNLSFADSGNINKPLEAMALEAVARKAVSNNAAERKSAIAALRSEGQAGLDLFLRAHSAELKEGPFNIGGTSTKDVSPEWQQLSASLDEICQQRDCYASSLYWYTDIEEAKRAAKASQRPILSLRLLGRLDEDLSCANSRFFRITLYANQEVSKYLREHFILHWQSVRSVPKVTIDFGDGRKLERTLTGNSIHYILDKQARPVDALPGLYGPQAFLRNLRRAEQAERECRGAQTEEGRLNLLRQYHVTRMREIAAAWASDITKSGISIFLSRDIDRAKSSAPTAEVAALAARTKMLVERPLLRGISSDPKMLDPTAEDAAWAKIGELHAMDARLDQPTKALMRSKNQSLYGARAGSATEAFERAAQALERSIAEDTARNEYVFHAKIHEWFATSVVATDVDKLNEKVYKEMFLTPASDPWLGLFPPNAYTGIENDGLRK